MVGVSEGGGGTRRLPPWMLAGATAGVAASTNRGGENSCCDKGRLVSEACEPEAEKQPRRRVKRKEKEVLEARSDAPQNVVKRTRKRLPEKDGSLPGNDSDENKDQELGRTVGESAPRRKRKAKGNNGNRLEIQSRACQDEEDLTVDDLLNIAQEYVRADEEIRLRSLPRGGKGSVSESCASTAMMATGSVVSDLGECPVVCNTGLGSCVDERRENSTAGSRDEPNVECGSRSGDPTEDMLGLLLGPLLKKPGEEKKQREMIAEVVELGNECRRERENEIGEGEVLQKKKGSLKEKVSMLLG